MRACSRGRSDLCQLSNRAFPECPFLVPSRTQLLLFCLGRGPLSALAVFETTTKEDAALSTLKGGGNAHTTPSATTTLATTTTREGDAAAPPTPQPLTRGQFCALLLWPVLHKEGA